MSEKPKSMSELQYRLKVLQDKYERLEYDLRDANHILLTSAVERAMNDRLEDVSWVWQRQADAIAAQMKEVAQEIKALTPAPELLEYMGAEFYFAYQEKYPINNETKLIQGYFPYQTWRYPLPTEHNAFEFLDTREPPAAFKMSYGEAVFERWRRGSGSEERLAYAKDINTVFVHREALHR